jgi:hypothetical protein
MARRTPICGLKKSPRRRNLPNPPRPDLTKKDQSAMRSSPGDPIFHRPPLTRPLLSLRCRFLVSHSPSGRTSEIVLPGTIPLSTRSVTSPANRPERLQKGVYHTHCTHWCLAWISGRSMIPSARTSKWQQPPATNHPPSNKMTSDKLPAPKCTTRKTLPVFLSGCQTVFRSNPPQGQPHRPTVRNHKKPTGVRHGKFYPWK